MWIVMLVLTGSSNPIPQLGNEDWKTREVMHTKLNNLVCSLLIPKRDENPEIDARLQRIHSRWGKYLDPGYYEQIERRLDWWAWFDKYMVQGESRIESRRELFNHFHSGTPAGNEAKHEFLKRYPLAPGDSGNWLKGIIWPHEYDIFLNHIRRFNVKYIVAREIGRAMLPYGFR